MTEVAVAVVPIVIAAVEAQRVSVVAATVAKQRRPVETVATSDVGLRTVAIARSGEEDAVSVGAGDLVTVYALLGCPTPSAVIT